jgi:oligoribonuclease (3'-5' exoribonuclease)
MKYNYAALDIETSGIDKSKCQVLEIAIILDDLTQQVTKEELEDYISNLPVFWCFLDYNTIVGEPSALAMHNRIFNILARKEPVPESALLLNPADVGFELRVFLRQHMDRHDYKLTIAGKNVASFDIPFLEQLPNFSNTVNSRRRVIDPAVLYMDFLQDSSPPSLSTCLTRARLDSCVKHTALDDTKDIIRLLKLSKIYK